MLFLVKGTFAAGVEARHEAIHESYNEHLSQRRPRVRLGAAMLDEAGGRRGVMLLIEAEDRAEIDRFVQASPYTKAGLYASVEIDVLDVEVGSLG